MNKKEKKWILLRGKMRKKKTRKKREKIQKTKKMIIMLKNSKTS